MLWINSIYSFLLLSFGGEAWIIHWLRRPAAPDLTGEQAAKILHLRREADTGL